MCILVKRFSFYCKFEYDPDKSKKENFDRYVESASNWKFLHMYVIAWNWMRKRKCKSPLNTRKKKLKEWRKSRWLSGSLDRAFNASDRVQALRRWQRRRRRRRWRWQKRRSSEWCDLQQQAERSCNGRRTMSQGWRSWGCKGPQSPYFAK